MAHNSGDVQVSLPPFDFLSNASSFSTDPVPDDDPEPFLHRAASFNSTSEDIETGPGSSGVKRTFSDVSLPGKTESPSKENFLMGKDILRRVTLRSPSSKSKTAVSRFTFSQELDEGAGFSIPEASTLKEKSHNVAAGSSSKDAPPELVTRPAKARSVSGKIVTLARRTWISSSSRSPSPSPKQSRRRGARSREQSPTPRSHAPSADSFTSKRDPRDAKTTATAVEPARKKTASNKRPRRPLSALVSRSKSDDLLPSPSSASLRSRISYENLTSLNVSTPVLPPIPRSTATSLPASVDAPRKKDELWSVFRGLEGEFQKYVLNSKEPNVIDIYTTLGSNPSLARSRPT
jgi:hypothetical protein